MQASDMATAEQEFRFSQAAGELQSSAIRELLSVVGREGMISMAGGLPAPDAFPAAEIAEIVARLVTKQPETTLQYSATEGFRDLREWVAQRHGAHLDQVVITSGSQQAMELIIRTLVDPGDAVALADPGYVGAIQAFQLNRATLHGITSDECGFDPDALDEALADGVRPALVYVVPNFHNPTGATMDSGRRRRLAELAERFGFYVIEDNPYGHLRWTGSEPAAVASMSDRVVSIGTTSKYLSPGLRVGWLVAPIEVARRIAIVKQAVDLHTSTLAQHTVFELVTLPGFLAAHLARLKVIYEARCVALATSLRRQLGDGVRFDVPDGGMFIWASLTDPDVDTAALLPRAVARGVAYVPGSAFAVEQPHAHELRLSFATATPQMLDTGVARLLDALNASGNDASSPAAH